MLEQAHPVETEVDTRVLKLAIFAVGGQGGGVLSNWIIDLAQSQGWHAQLTSVPGVAQRTGATIYYVELAPPSERRPVFALIPTPGHVDVVLAAELMEAGRAMQRGLVGPATTVITSTHRAYAVAEKTVPGDGILPGDEVLRAAQESAARVVSADMDRIAVDNGSVVSSSLFGALCAAGVLPFDEAAFESTIRSGGRGVEASVAAFRACIAELGRDAGNAPGSPEAPPATGTGARAPGAPEPRGPARLVTAYRALAERCQALPEPARPVALAGLRKTVDYQDVAYGEEYLARVAEFHELDGRRGGEAREWALTTEAARHVANAMTYDDVIRVADLKSRGARFDRVRADAGAGPGQLLHVTEYFHPRLEEALDTLPVDLARAIRARPWLRDAVGGFFRRGRRVRSDSIRGFVSLYLLSALRPHRRRLSRHATETAHMERWLAEARASAQTDYALAVEVLRARKLIKGYSDTHARGASKFDRVMGTLEHLRGRSDGAAWMGRLIAAARRDEHGAALDELLESLRSSLH